MINNKNIRERINQVSKETGVPTKKVSDLLFALRTGKPVENNELVQRIGISKNALNQAKELLSSLLKPPSKNTQLDASAIQEIQSIFGAGYKSEEALWSILENENYRRSIELLEKYTDQRPSPERKYDQFTATIETTARRASLLSFFGDVKGKRLLFLGDDDFTSVATANLGEAKSVVVVDIDERILGEIRNVSENHSLGIETVKYDARQKLLKELVGKFDVVFTDPPYTTEGVGLFVSRAVELLDGDNKAARVYVCYGSSDRAKERFLPIYEVFTNLGLMMRWVFDKFNRYQGAESIGSSSVLFIAEVTLKTKPIIKGDYERPIYTNN
ncbi:MAG TPA: bis-aminopropyl spermidine synthase family protein [Nevskiaceae bacterium]|nr:bis-aminopropyl spermidine synthase family protein [Nevskiaceae bacterium]